jgi:hypothetical protein
MSTWNVSKGTEILLKREWRICGIPLWFDRSLFSNNLARVFIIPHGDEFDVADMVRICPF